MKETVAVIGDGGWGTALALVLNANGHRIRVWGPFAEAIDAIRARGENAEFLPGVALPPEITWTADRAEAVADAGTLILAVPTKYFSDVVGAFRTVVPDGAAVLSVAKGLERDSHRRMSETACALLGTERVAALSGPSHAEEVARGVPTAVTVAADDPALAGELQALLSNARFRVYTSADMLGVELGGALKNVIAIAVGMSDGLGFGDNTRAALITRGLAEITRLGTALGADPRTFAGLSGMGDLIVTCTSRLSRNRAIGERIGRGEPVEAILAGTKQAAEGIWNCAAAQALARAHGVSVPITDEVTAIVHDGKPPREAVEALMGRETKPED
jgi:glycerol-3-phosphate dehydrogenase (NAD(P)+)